MKILHVASFVGNVGDNASHLGLQKILSEYFDYVEIERLEIRKFYKNYQHDDKLFFDSQFIDFANTFELLIIGGGGFLDYWLEDSATGTTIDMNPELVSTIKVPTLICSVGCMPHKSVPVGNIAKFRRFLDVVTLNPQVVIALRNDGSILSLKNDIGIKYLKDIYEVLDNGFFFNTDKSNPLLMNREYVAINITSDQLKMNGLSRGAIDKALYLSALAKTITYIIEELLMDVVFVPHIYSDLDAISEVLGSLDDFVVREHISVAPCLQHDNGAEVVFSIYKNSRLVIGSRFHANVCSLAMEKPTLGLVALDRVKYVYDQIGMSEGYVLLDYDFSDDLIKKIDATLMRHSFIAQRLNSELDARRKASKDIYYEIFDKLGFVADEKK